MLPPNKTHFRKVWSANKRAGTANLDRGFDRQGTPATIRIKRVCGPCNSGWMGDYEEAVRPLLAQAVLGTRLTLDAAQQRLLVEYLTFKMMVVDWEADTPVVGDSDRRAFYKKRTIPKNTQIFLFKCGEPPWRLNFFGHALGLWPEDKPPPTTGLFNIKSFAMGFGDLFVMTILAPNVDGYPRLSFEPGLSVQLYPLFNDPISWPPVFTINAAWADHCAHALWNIDDYPGFKSGSP